MDFSDVIRGRRTALGLSQAQLAERAGVSLRQLARYEAGEQQPVLAAAVTLADALGISLTQLAGQVSYDLDLSGEWWAGWQTWKEGLPRIDIHALQINQRGEILQLVADRAVPVAEGSYRWQGELRLWDNEALLGWYRSTDQAVRSKGTLYLALHPHGDRAWGRWVGMSYDGQVVTGWGSLARNREQAHQVVQNLIDREPATA
ncbi:helix-turn-helix domain-containing protein [Microlunatus ginsengisoli]|uniref:HTH cro/C1-type domain-containing protein n=1 Tax=Microlunatus ginsengisoli TaxID=363863 RepID=A0ABP6ZKF4_9ACTN